MANSSAGRGPRGAPASFRRHDAFADDDDEHDEHVGLGNGRDRNGRSSRGNKAEELVSFDRNGAVKKNRSPPPAAPRVIPMVANLDWRQDRKKRLGIEDKARSMGSLHSMRDPRRQGEEAGPSSAAAPERINDEEQKRDLQVRQRQNATDDDAMDEDAPDAAVRASATPPAEDGDRAETPPPETAEQAAIRALLAGEGVGSTSAQKLELIISQSDDKQLFQSDVETRPEAPSLDDYAATPVDQFGAALLRGMGWKEGKGAGRNGKGPTSAPEPKKRAALLGLGAKERAVDPSLPASKSKRPQRPERRYVPVAAGPSSSASASRNNAAGGRDDGRQSSAGQSTRRRDDRSSSPPRRYDDRDRRREPADSHRHRDSERDRSSYRDRDGERDRERDRRSGRDRDGYGRSRDEDRYRDSRREERRDEGSYSERNRSSRDTDRRERDRDGDRDRDSRRR